MSSDANDNVTDTRETDITRAASLGMTLTITPHSVGQPPAQASGPGTNKQTAGGDTEAGARDAAQEMDGAGAGGA